MILVSTRALTLRDRILESEPTVSVCRPKYYTESMKQTEGEPMILRQAKALTHVLQYIPVKIFPGELVVGARGYAEWATFRKVLNHTDLVLYDVKTTEPERHETLTGVSSKLILANLERVCMEKVPVLVRIPVIPNHNFVDSEEDARKIVDFLQG